MVKNKKFLEFCFRCKKVLHSTLDWRAIYGSVKTEIDKEKNKLKITEEEAFDKYLKEHPEEPSEESEEPIDDEETEQEPEPIKPKTKSLFGRRQ